MSIPLSQGVLLHSDVSKNVPGHGSSSSTSSGSIHRLDLCCVPVPHVAVQVSHSLQEDQYGPITEVVDISSIEGTSVVKAVVVMCVVISGVVVSRIVVSTTVVACTVVGNRGGVVIDSDVIMNIVVVNRGVIASVIVLGITENTITST